MKKIKVQLVRYDMSKTKKRNRKDMLVDNQSEEAVIAQLEKIHKGERVVEIHELVWDERQIKEVARLRAIDQKHLFYGTVKFFAGGVAYDNDRVEFKISEGPKGLCAIQVKLIEIE